MYWSLFVLALCSQVWVGHSYKPVLAMHGFAISETVGTYHDWDNVVQWVQEAHPGQVFIPLNTFNGLESTRPLWEQVPVIKKLIQSIVSNDSRFAGGYHLMGHSQGGLLTRVMLEELDTTLVDTYISLAGVQFGIYGVGFIERYFSNVTDGFITDLFYTTPLQDEFSPANFWHSPYDEASSYLTKNLFLPVVNNETPTTSRRYKENFTSAKKYVFFCLTGRHHGRALAISHLGLLRRER